MTIIILCGVVNNTERDSKLSDKKRFLLIKRGQA